MEEQGLLELTGAVEEVQYHNEKNQYTVLQLATPQGDLVTVVGAFPFVSEGEELRVYGTWGEHPTYGEQFMAQAFDRARPATTAAMLKYLSSGAVKGVGPAMARRIIQTFGAKSLEVMEQEPERLAQVKGITLEKAREIGAELNRVYGIRELMTFLGGYGVSPESAVLVWKQYGNQSVSCIQEDPYCLCDPEIGLSFPVADSIAESVEKPRDDWGRLQAGVLYVLRHNLDNGHTCLPQDKLRAAAAATLQVEQELVEDAIYQLCENLSLGREEIGGKTFLFLQQQHLCESYIAARMKAMLRMPPNPLGGADVKIREIEEERGIRYADKQKEAIRAAMEQGVLLLTGGPGTGKTTTLNAIIHLLKEAGEKVFLAAPTGRAAKRMSELTGEEAKTIHRMLQVDWDEQDRPVFTRNERNPLECDCLVIDELSMVDAYVFESVLRALPLSCRLILVGDKDQLPSVGAGERAGGPDGLRAVPHGGAQGDFPAVPGEPDRTERPPDCGGAPARAAPARQRFLLPAPRGPGAGGPAHCVPVRPAAAQKLRVLQCVGHPGAVPRAEGGTGYWGAEQAPAGGGQSPGKGQGGGEDPWELIPPGGQGDAGEERL